MNRIYHGNYFFVLSKGNNAGRPMNKPCPNCFVVITHCPEEKQLLYWLCFGLWQCHYFRPHLIGSVIPFIRLTEFKSIILEILARIDSRKPDYEKAANAMNSLENCRQNMLRQLEVVEQTKKILMSKLLNP